MFPTCEYESLRFRDTNAARVICRSVPESLVDYLSVLLIPRPTFLEARDCQFPRRYRAQLASLAKSKGAGQCRRCAPVFA